MLSTRDVARNLPDLPRWVEARSLLLWDPCELWGLEAEPELSLALRDPDTEAVFVIGAPAATAIRAAVGQNVRGGEVIARWEQAPWLAAVLPGWRHSRIIVHQLADPSRLPGAAAGTIGFLDPSILSELALDDDLREELESGAEHSLIAATFVGRQPVAFCYAGATTETLWDISIDTLPEHRRRGYAALCVAHMIRHMQAQGKQPVWQALEENTASWRLAQKLGFVPVDELVLFEPRAPAGVSNW